MGKNRDEEIEWEGDDLEDEDGEVEDWDVDGEGEGEEGIEEDGDGLGEDEYGDGIEENEDVDEEDEEIEVQRMNNKKSEKATIRWATDEDEDGEVEQQEYDSDELEAGEDEQQEDPSTSNKQAQADIEKAKAVQLTESVWSQSIDCFLSQGKCLFEANKLPVHNTFHHFYDHSTTLQNEVFQAKLALIGLIQDLQTLRSTVSSDASENTFESCFGSLSKLDVKSTKRTAADGKLENHILNGKISSDPIFHGLESGLKSRLQNYGSIAENWFTKTNIQASSSDRVR